MRLGAGARASCAALHWRPFCASKMCLEPRFQMEPSAEQLSASAAPWGVLPDVQQLLGRLVPIPSWSRSPFHPGAGPRSILEQVPTAFWSRSLFHQVAGPHSVLEQVPTASWSRSPFHQGAGPHCVLEQGSFPAPGDAGTLPAAPGCGTDAAVTQSVGRGMRGRVLALGSRCVPSLETFPSGFSTHGMYRLLPCPCASSLFSPMVRFGGLRCVAGERPRLALPSAGPW